MDEKDATKSESTQMPQQNSGIMGFLSDFFSGILSLFSGKREQAQPEYVAPAENKPAPVDSPLAPSVDVAQAPDRLPSGRTFREAGNILKAYIESGAASGSSRDSRIVHLPEEPKKVPYKPADRIAEIPVANHTTVNGMRIQALTPGEAATKAHMLAQMQQAGLDGKTLLNAAGMNNKTRTPLEIRRDTLLRQGTDPAEVERQLMAWANSGSADATAYVAPAGYTPGGKSYLTAEGETRRHEVSAERKGRPDELLYYEVKTTGKYNAVIDVLPEKGGTIKVVHRRHAATFNDPLTGVDGTDVVFDGLTPEAAIEHLSRLSVTGDGGKVRLHVHEKAGAELAAAQKKLSAQGRPMQICLNNKSEGNAVSVEFSCRNAQTLKTLVSTQGLQNYDRMNLALATHDGSAKPGLAFSPGAPLNPGSSTPTQPTAATGPDL